MRTLVWIITATAIAIWSAIAWLAHMLIGASGNLMATNADILPLGAEAVELASWLASFGTSVGEWLVVALWAIVALVFYGTGYVVTRLVPRRELVRG